MMLARATLITNRRNLVLINSRCIHNSIYSLNANSTENKRSSITVDNATTKTIVQNESKELDLTFENSEIAYKSKTNAQLLQALFVFNACSVQSIVNNQIKLINIGKKILGKRLFAMFMKSTFFGHFVGGEDGSEIRGLVKQLKRDGITGMVVYNAEEDLASEKKIAENQVNVVQNVNQEKYYHESEAKSDVNTKNTLDCIDTAADVSLDDAITAIKVTAFVRPPVLLKLSSLMEKSLARKDDACLKDKKTIFNFIGAEYDKMDLNEWKNVVREKSRFGQVFNVDSKDEQLSVSQLGEFRNLLKRLDKMAKRASEKKVQVFVDAEQTYFQWAITELTIELMRKYNKSNQLTILNTYQNYLKSTHETLKEHLKQSREEGFYFGAKLVRGAYIEQERTRAKEMGYEDPIQPDFDATTRNYEQNLLYCLNEIKSREVNCMKIVAASHNEDTVRYAVKKMNELNINKNDKSVYFGQLLGMCDFISYSVAASGYGLIKAVPYGPLDEVLPYLTRRANENRGIFGKVKKEKRLLTAELMRRLKKGQLLYKV